jgi:hypothetical protein
MWGTFCDGYPEMPYKYSRVIDEWPEFLKLSPGILL